MQAAQQLVEQDARAAHASAPGQAEVAELADVERELFEHEPTPRDVSTKGKARGSARDGPAPRRDDDNDQPRTPRITLNDEELPGSHWGSSPPSPPASERTRAIPRPRDVVHSPTLTARRKRRRREFWRAAVVPLVYILLWYCFSTLLSVYSPLGRFRRPLMPQTDGCSTPSITASDTLSSFRPAYARAARAALIGQHMVVQSGLSALVLLVVPSLRPATRPQPRNYLCGAMGRRL